MGDNPSSSSGVGPNKPSTRGGVLFSCFYDCSRLSVVGENRESSTLPGDFIKIILSPKVVYVEMVFQMKHPSALA